MRYFLCFNIFVMLTFSVIAQKIDSYKIGFPRTFPPPSDRIRSNTINVLTTIGDTLWVGSGRSLSYTPDKGVSWYNFSPDPVFEDLSISAIAGNSKILWVALASTVEQDGQRYPKGGGLAYSTNRGISWSRIPQPIDTGIVDTIDYGNNRIPSLAVTTSINNITYDIAVTEEGVWIASFAGMLRFSSDRGNTWKKIVLPPDNRNGIDTADVLDFDYSPSSGRLGLRGNLNHALFSVFASNDSTLWVGTAGGINRTTNKGVSWTKFSHQNQHLGISGNFVISINEQNFSGKKILWAGTVNADDPREQRGVSYSSNGGLEWRTTLPGVFANNIAFHDSIVYVATDRGLFRSSDGGRSWTKPGPIVDALTFQRFTQDEMIAVAWADDELWLGGSEGLARSEDTPSSPLGSAWSLHRAYQSVLGASNTYSYPLPFSPQLEVVRIHFEVPPSYNQIPFQIRIFNFGMQPVRTLVNKIQRTGGKEYDEIWDGKDDAGSIVANGAYFYKITFDGHVPLWGKILVIR